MVINDNYFFKDKNLTNLKICIQKYVSCTILPDLLLIHLLIGSMLYYICTQEKTPTAEEKSKQSVENLVARRGNNNVADKLILFHLKIQTQLVKGQIAACASQVDNLKDLLYKIITN